MPTYRVYITYSLPEYFEVVANDEDEAIELVMIELGELVDVDFVKVEIEEQEKEEESEEDLL